MSLTTMRKFELRLRSSALLLILIFVIKFSGEVDAACQQGWSSFNGSCYKFIESRATYPEALGFCEREGYELLTVNSSEENDFVKTLTTGAMWLAINDLFHEGHWVIAGRTEDHWKKTPVTFTNWMPNEPNDIIGEDCAEMYRGGGWNDLACYWRIFFMCETKEKP